MLEYDGKPPCLRGLVVQRQLLCMGEINDSQKTAWSRRLSILSALALSALLVTPLCGWVFSCGCTWPWAGLSANCNAFLAAAPPPHCPWCVRPGLGLMAIGAAFAAGAVAAMRRRPWSDRASLAFIDRLLCGAAGFVLTLFAVGFFTAVAADYPSFLGFPLP